MFDELVKAVRMHLSERLTSPLLGAFAVSWLIWNFRFLIIVFSSESVESKLGLIDSIAFPTLWLGMLRGFAGPLTTALVWIFAYPYPAKSVYEFARKRQRDLLAIRRAIEEETPLTIEDTKKFRQEFALREQALNAENDRKDQEIAKLQRLLDGKDQEKESEQVANSSHIDGDLIDMLGELVSVGGSATREDLLGWSRFDKIKAEYIIGELTDRGIIDEGWNDKTGRSELFLTQRGRGAWLEYSKGKGS